MSPAEIRLINMKEHKNIRKLSHIIFPDVLVFIHVLFSWSMSKLFPEDS